jgi:hypothetical protein
MHKVRFLAIITGVWLTGACTAEHRYDGDGDFVDHGPTAATDRYVIDFGPIDLSRETEATFRMRDLPPVEFAVGIQLERLDQQRLEPQDAAISAAVSVGLKEEHGGTVLHISMPLRDWNWSHIAMATDYFLYVRDTQGGLFFTPEKNREYVLTVRVIQADTGTPLRAHVVMKSGGWK